MKSQQHFTDEALVAMLLNGKERDTAMRYLLFADYPLTGKLEYSGMVFGTVRAFVMNGGGNEQHVDDVVSEGAIQLITNVGRGDFDGKSKLTTYLIAICKNKWFEMRSGWKKTDLYGDASSFEGQSHISADDNVVSEEMEARIRKRNELLPKLIKQLKHEACQQALIDYIMKGVKYEVLHKILNLENVHQARKKVSACLKQLIAIINGDDDLKNFLKSTI